MRFIGIAESGKIRDVAREYKAYYIKQLLVYKGEDKVKGITPEMNIVASCTKRLDIGILDEQSLDFKKQIFNIARILYQESMKPDGAIIIVECRYSVKVARAIAIAASRELGAKLVGWKAGLKIDRHIENLMVDAISHIKRMESGYK